MSGAADDVITYGTPALHSVLPFNKLSKCWHMFCNTTHRMSPFAESLNPYLTVLLTVTTTMVCGYAQAQNILWEDLVQFLDCVASHYQ